MTQQFHTLICLNIIFLPLIDLRLLMWFFHYYSFKLSHKNYTLFSLKPPFSNLTFVYFWRWWVFIYTCFLNIINLISIWHLYLPVIFVTCLTFFLGFPKFLNLLDYHLWRNVSFDTISNDLEVCSIHHLTWVPWRFWAILGNTFVKCYSDCYML